MKISAQNNPKMIPNWHRVRQNIEIFQFLNLYALFVQTSKFFVEQNIQKD